MNLFTGLLKVALTEPFKPRLESLEGGVEVSFRVWPHDLDVNLHMNNARYLMAMEVARWALLVRAGFLRRALREGWAMVNAAQNVSFFRSLKLFHRYAVHCRLLYADDGWLYMEEKVRHQGRLVATGLFRMRIKRGAETLSPREVARSGGYQLDRTDLPARLRGWNQVSDVLLAERREDDAARNDPEDRDTSGSAQ